MECNIQLNTLFCRFDSQNTSTPECACCWSFLCHQDEEGGPQMSGVSPENFSEWMKLVLVSVMSLKAPDELVFRLQW